MTVTFCNVRALFWSLMIALEGLSEIYEKSESIKRTREAAKKQEKKERAEKSFRAAKAKSKVALGRVSAKLRATLYQASLKQQGRVDLVAPDNGVVTSA